VLPLLPLVLLVLLVPLVLGEDVLVAVGLGDDHLEVTLVPAAGRQVLQEPHQLLEPHLQQPLRELLHNRDEDKHHQVWERPLTRYVGVEQPDGHVGAEHPQQHGGNAAERHCEEVNVLPAEVVQQLPVDAAQQLLDPGVGQPEPVEALGVVASH